MEIQVDYCNDIVSSDPNSCRISSGETWIDGDNFAEWFSFNSLKSLQQQKRLGTKTGLEHLLVVRCCLA